MSFRAKHNLQFPLIYDTRKEISKLYGGIGKIMRRSKRITFLIDEAGYIRKIWTLTSIFAQLNLGSHAAKIRTELLKLPKIENTQIKSIIPNT